MAIIGVDVGVPAIVDLKKGVVHESVNISSWNKVPLKKIIERKFKVPVIINIAVLGAASLCFESLR